MKYKRWSDKEKQMLKTTMSNSEIAEKTSRTVKQVKEARRYYTGISTSWDRARIKPLKHSKIAGECRILSLCKKIHVRLGA